jgi:hypothetical protein
MFLHPGCTEALLFHAGRAVKLSSTGANISIVPSSVLRYLPSQDD